MTIRLAAIADIPRMVAISRAVTERAGQREIGWQWSDESAMTTIQAFISGQGNGQLAVVYEDGGRIVGHALAHQGPNLMDLYQPVVYEIACHVDVSLENFPRARTYRELMMSITAWASLRRAMVVFAVPARGGRALEKCLRKHGFELSDQMYCRRAK